MWSIELSKILEVLKYDPVSPLMFNSGFFLFFFLLVALVINFIKGKNRARNIFLMLVSFYFYYKSSGFYLGILIFTTLFDYHIAHIIHQSASKRRRMWLLIVSLTVNLGVLFYFKYTNFLFSSFSQLFSRDFTPFDIFLPVGISFFTFQSLSYTIDVYLKKIEPVRQYTDYAFFVSFFPQLVAGPIVRAKDFLPQIYKDTVVTDAMMGRGMFLIVSGLFKKVVISDYISINFVDRIFDAPLLYSGTENLLGVYGYALQIYCDFSGYSDMAIGLALLLGFEFNLNFRSPYVATSMTDFWRRWHISLSTWLRDYLYIPLGGNRKGLIRTYINLFITMLLGGLWHGASILFVIWGAWHGLLLALDKLRLSYFHLDPKTRLQQIGMKYFGMLLTFHLVCFGWIFFRAGTLEVAGQVISQIASGLNFGLLSQFVDGYALVSLLLVVGYFFHILPDRYEQIGAGWIARMPLWGKALFMALFVYLLVQVRSLDIQPFIYFQF